MGQALYRQYRPKNLDDVAGQDHITTTLKNALKSGKISHAYLFTGPRGVGKTSVARILAHEVNGFNYDESLHLDIIEIDAASNRRIDEIRDLRDKVHIAPTSGKYKVYIIDEVHMLTKEAFNALLKTLEEPPAHVIFILATTESHKLPETIISRTQRFGFKPIEKSQIVDHLIKIAKQEKISVDQDALELIADHSDGSLRDSLSLLDQASSSVHKVDLESVMQLLGIAPNDAIELLITAMVDGSPQLLIKNLNSLEEQGFQSTSVAKQLSENLRQQLIDGSSQLDSVTILNLLQQLIAVPASPNPDKFLEVILLDIVFKNTDLPIVNKQQPPKANNPLPKTANIEKPRQEIKKPDLIKDSQSLQNFTLDHWPKILDSLKTRHNTLYGILRMSQPSFENDVLTLTFKFSFHQKRIGEPKMQQLINTTFLEMRIQPVRIITTVSSENSKPALVESQPQVDIAAISNIFGDAEMLES